MLTKKSKIFHITKYLNLKAENIVKIHVTATPYYGHCGKQYPAKN